MNSESHLAEARNLYWKAVEGFKRAKEKNDPMLPRDACAKGWLAAVEAAYALMVKKGVKEEELPRADRGRGYMVSKYAEREVGWLYFSLKKLSSYCQGFYNCSLGFEEVEKYLERSKMLGKGGDAQ